MIIQKILTFLNRVRKSRSGVETAEMAMNLPILLYVVFSCIVFLLSIYSKIVLIDAVREGARVAAISSPADRIIKGEEKVQEILLGGGLKWERVENPGDIINTSDNDSFVTARISYRQPTIIPGLPGLLGEDVWADFFILRAESVFKKETTE